MSQINLNTDQAVKEIRELLQQLTQLRTAMNSIKGNSGESFNQLARRVDELERKMKQLNSTINTVAKTTGRMQSQLNKLDNTSKKFNRTSKGMGRRLRELAGAAGFAGVGYAVFQLVRNVVQLTIKFDSLGYAMEKTAGTAWEAGSSMAFLVDLNNTLGANLVSTTERWLKFRTAARNTGLTLLESEKIFKSVTKASAVLGLRTDELRGVYLALEQMLSKGKITTEELRRQLGERLPGAMGIMADSMGVTISELDKMMKRGEVLSAEVLPNFADALEKAYGIENVERVENLAVAVGTLSGEWQQLVRTVADGDSIISGTIGGTMAVLERFLFTLNRIFMNLDQIGERLLPQKTEKYLKVYEQNADKAINKTDEFTKSITELKTEQDALALATKIATNEGDEELAKSHKKRLNMVTEEINAYKDRRKEIMRVAAIADLPRLEYEEQELRKEAGAVENLSVMKEIAREMNSLTPKLAEEYALQAQLTEAQIKWVEKYGELNAARKLAELGTRQTPTGTTGIGSEKAVRYAKEYAETNRLAILVEREHIKVNQDLLSQIGHGYDEREKWQKENRESAKLIADYQLEDQLRANDVWLHNEKRKYDTWLSRFSPDHPKFEKQKEQHKKAMERIEKRHAENMEFIWEQNASAKNAIDLKSRMDDIDLVETEYQRKMELLEAEFLLQNQNIDERMVRTAKGFQAEKNLLMERQALEVQYHNDQIDLLIERLKLRKALATDKDTIAYWDKMIAQAETSRKIFRDLNSELYHGEDAWLNWWNKGQEVLNAVGDLVDELFNNRIVQIDKEIQAEEKKYDRLLELAKNDDAEREIIERNRRIRIEQLEEKRRKEQIRQAKFQKALALTQAVNDGAASVNAMLKAGPGLGFALAAIATAISALNVATIIAQPIPAYAEGVDNLAKAERALINEAGSQEYVERNGRILTTDKRNAIVDLKAGDTVYPNFDDMVRRSAVYNSMVGGQAISEDDYNRLFLGIEGSMKRGIKNAKFSTRVAIEQADGYKQQMSYWN